MNTTRQDYIILFSCLCVSLFIYLDAYLLPRKTSIEIVQHYQQYDEQGRHGTYHYYTLTTDQRKYDITQSLCYDLLKGDTLQMIRSSITNAIQQAYLARTGYIYTIGYLQAGDGCFYVPTLLGGLILSLIFYKKIDYLPGRRRLSLIALISTIIVFLLYLQLPFFR